MPRFALYDAKGTIQRMIGGTIDQATAKFVKANVPEGLFALNIPAGHPASSSPADWQVVAGKLVKRSG